MSDPRARPGARSLLAELNQHVARVSPPASELRSVQAFRETWSRIATDQQVSAAVQGGPDNAGPLNSHRLALRSLALMQGLSPAYVRRFVAQLDALLWLDQAGSRTKPPAVKAKPARQKR